MTFDWLYRPLESADAWLAGGLDAAGLVIVIALAILLGLRHATDPDHLIAVSVLISAEDARTRDAMALGAWWGAGHAAILLLVGMPLVALGSSLPAWLESAAERLVGVAILAIALRVLWRWRRRGPLAAGPLRSPAQAAAIGVLHGLGGTGTIVVLFLTALHTPVQAAAALAVFAPMSAVSMVAVTGAYSWALTRGALAGAHQRVGMPALGLFALTFGTWYAGAL